MRIGQYTVKGRVIQAPDENIRRLFTFTRWMEEGEYITSVSVSIDNATTPPLVVENIVIDPDGQRIAYYTNGGVDKEDYNVKFTVQTSVNQTRSDIVIVSVREQRRG